ncbi:hypothetical protein LA080_002605 [Diaporthe eres]|nr:hypothetical protein LA080_002605 [Diaporthe eres]
MAPKFSKYQEVIYQAADNKYKGKVEEYHEISGRSGSYYETSVTTNSETQGWEDITHKTVEKVSEGSLSKA